MKRSKKATTARWRTWMGGQQLSVGIAQISARPARDGGFKWSCVHYPFTYADGFDTIDEAKASAEEWLRTTLVESIAALAKAGQP